MDDEPKLTQEEAGRLAEFFEPADATPQPDTSKNERAEQLMGLRPTDVVAFDQPCEIGYRCPVCLVPAVVTGEFDERLTWSEYQGFLWCSVCDYDYPSALCVDLAAGPDPQRPWVHAGRDAAVAVFLATVEQALAHKERSGDGR